MNNWKPIDTAPMDQTAVLAVHESSGIMGVCFRDDYGSPNYKMMHAPGTWTPTHWVALPLAPPRPVATGD